jgi:hypothetical protein
MESICYFCGTPLLWVEEQDKESYGYQGEGIVAHMTCTECNADVLFIENREA